MKKYRVGTDKKFYHIVEHTAGHYSYHLKRSSRGLEEDTTLCGKVNVMGTGIPINGWGCIGDSNEKWCTECRLIMEKE
jgi:hypothetical protein